MVDIALLQSVSYIAGSVGVFIAAIFYVLNLRINQRNMKQTLETRQFQLLMQLSEFITTKEGMKNYLEFISMEWKDYDDFEKKYGSDANPDSYALRESMAGWFNKAGILLRHGMIDKELLYDFLGIGAIGLWNKYGEIIRTQREIWDMPQVWRDWDYLYDEMVKIAAERGRDPHWNEDPRYTDEIKRKISAKSA
jgi:hypothetical protein